MSTAAAPQLSGIVAGTWRLRSWGKSTAELQHWIEQCVELGVTSFDHADIYGDYAVEEAFGSAFGQLCASTRQRMQLISKCGIRLLSQRRPSHRVKSYDSGAAHIRTSVEHSLRALRCERLELLLLHRPDFLADPCEIAGVFEQLRREGKVGHFGVSNFSPSQFAVLASCTALVTNQIEFSPLCLTALTDGTLEQSLQLRLRPMAWSPLGGGQLFNGSDERASRVRSSLQQLGSAYGLTLTGAALAWVGRHPSRPVPIVGSGRVEAFREAVAALPIELDRESWYAVWRASQGQDLP